MSSTLQQLERIRSDLGSLIEQAAQEAAVSEDIRAYQVGRQDMRRAVASMLSARAIDLRAGNKHSAADAISRAARAVEEMR